MGGRSKRQFGWILAVASVALIHLNFSGKGLKKNIVAAPATAAATPESSWNWAYNALQVKNGRSTYDTVCNSLDATNESIAKAAKDLFAPPQSNSLPPSRLRSPSLTLSCENTFLDFGSNIGDSLGKFINSGIESCGEQKETPKYSIHQGVVVLQAATEKSNALTEWASLQAHKQSTRIGRDLHPEDYCFYGLEGNPFFTQRLKDLQELVERSSPRPLRRVHFFTETVGTKVDGPATLYLDTINEKTNFWGSSIHTQHNDVKSSAKATDDKPIAVNVTGITLTTLVPLTTMKQAGNHLLIKMDIEGAEIDVLGEAFDSGVLCDYANAGVQVDLVVEFHNRNVMGGIDSASWKFIQYRWNQVVIPGLKECGVTVYDGSETAGM